MSEPLLIGVDGGGTKTLAWVAARDGAILGRALVARPANQKVVGFDAATNAIAEAIDAGLRDAGRASSEGSMACFGLAGFDRPEDRHALADWGNRRFRFAHLELVNDGELVLAAGTPEGWGVAVIAGTGSIAVGRSPSGNATRSGGWGPIFGDEGSGYGTAVAALRRVAEIHDGRRSRSPSADLLTARICRAVGVGDPTELVAAIYAPRFDRPRIAALAEAVVAAADFGSDDAHEILTASGVALARAVRAVADSLGLSRGPLPLALAGGFLLASKIAETALIDSLQRSCLAPLPSRVAEPVQGAIAIAQRIAPP